MHLTIFTQEKDPLFSILRKAIIKWPIFKKKYEIESSTFQNFYAKRLKRFTFKNFYAIKCPLLIFFYVDKNTFTIWLDQFKRSQPPL